MLKERCMSKRRVVLIGACGTIAGLLLPALAAAGVDDAARHTLTHVNPFRAFAR